MWGGAGEVTPPVHFRNFFVWFRPYLIFNQNQKSPRKAFLCCAFQSLAFAHCRVVSLAVVAT
jgi:hypothetical protein